MYKTGLVNGSGSEGNIFSRNFSLLTNRKFYAVQVYLLINAFHICDLNFPEERESEQNICEQTVSMVMVRPVKSRPRNSQSECSV